jgi:hypothetical protein
MEIRVILLILGAVMVVALPGIALAGTNIEIQSPSDGAEYHEGDEVTFIVEPLVDVETIEPPIRYTLLSDLDGDISGKVRIIGYFGVLKTGGMSQGKHTLTLKLADAGSTTGEDTVSITILEPREGEPLLVSYEGLLEATARMDEEGRFVIDETTTDVERTAIQIQPKESPEEALAKEIKVVEYTGYTGGDAPPGTKDFDPGVADKVLDTFVEIEAPDLGVEWTVISLEWDPSDLAARGIDVDDLHVIWYDEEAQEWISLQPGSPDWVQDAGIDKENNKVWVKVSHFSVYGMSGSIIKPSVPGPAMTVKPPTGTTTPTEPPVTTLPPKPTTEAPKAEEKGGICGPGMVLMFSLAAIPARRLFKR